MVHTINLIPLRILILIIWLKYCLSSFCCVKLLSFLLFHIVLFGKKSLCLAHTYQRWYFCPISFRAEYVHNLFGIFTWDLFILPHLFIYTVTCLYKCRLRDLYFTLRVTIQYYFIYFLQISSVLAIENSFSWLVTLCCICVCACMCVFVCMYL